jgi:hypothetical protein
MVMNLLSVIFSTRCFHTYTVGEATNFLHQHDFARRWHCQLIFFFD